MIELFLFLFFGFFCCTFLLVGHVIYGDSLCWRVMRGENEVWSHEEVLQLEDKFYNH